VNLRDLFDGAADGVLVVDQTDRVVYWNESATEILGYQRAEAVGRECHALLGGLGERGTVVCGPECSLKRCAFQGEKVHNFNLFTAHKDGHRLWLNMSTMCATDFDGRGPAIVHMFRDIDRLHDADEVWRDAVSRTPSGPSAPIVSREALTARELQVLDLLGKGMTSRQIAERLTIAETTARNHIQNILNKLGVHSRLEAALYARERRA
jgi:PAS domain S-box-containing protein